MFRIFSTLAIFTIAACATATPYGPAKSSDAAGFAVQKIETNRFQVSYTDRAEPAARSNALRRAAEITLEQGQTWFQIVSAYSDLGADQGRSSSSVSIGTSTGSRGSNVGVGIGIGLPIGSGAKVKHVLEIITGSGDAPNTADTYQAEDVVMNLAGPPAQ